LLGFFYEHIFSVTGYPDSIIDHACGLNPLTIPWMNLPESTEYCAYDIDVCQIRFLNSVFNILGLPQGINIGSGDVILDRFGYSDIVFMLKLLPPLEHQSKGSSLKIMQNQECRKMVISFPVKSLSGNEKGMAEFYSGWFINLIKDKWKYKRLDFDTELVFIVEK